MVADAKRLMHVVVMVVQQVVVVVTNGTKHRCSARRQTSGVTGRAAAHAAGVVAVARAIVVRARAASITVQVVVR